MKTLINSLAKALDNLGVKIDNYLFPPVKEEAKPFQVWFDEMNKGEMSEQLLEHYSHVNSELKSMYRERMLSK